MASVVHGPPPDVSPVAAEAEQRLKEAALPLDDLAVWIDPIGEYWTVGVASGGLVWMKMLR